MAIAALPELAAWRKATVPTVLSVLAIALVVLLALLLFWTGKADPQITLSGSLKFDFAIDSKSPVTATPKRVERDLVWALGVAPAVLDLADKLGQSAAACAPLSVPRQPAFGRVDVAGARLTYLRAGREALGAARADALDYELTCGTTTWSGVISITSSPATAPAIDLGDVEVRLRQFVPTPVGITDLALGSALPAGDWRWQVAPQGDSVLSTKAADGRHVDILLQTDATERVAFELRAVDGRSARGTMIVVPQRN
jgi:hypothetical protein